MEKPLPNPPRGGGLKNRIGKNIAYILFIFDKHKTETMQNSVQSIELAIVEKLKPINPIKIILFGSYAYGTTDADSDLDICVVKKK